MTNSNTDTHTDRSDGSEEEHFSRANRQHDSFFGSLWGLPAAIYKRGNEHGREFRRVFEEREQQRGQSRWDGSQRRRDEEEPQQLWINETSQQRKDEEDQQRRDERMMDDWVGRVVRELESREEQAKDMYEMWSRMGFDGADGNDKVAAISGSAMQKNEKEIEQANATWADIFPAWSSEAKKDEKCPLHVHVFARDEAERRRPLSSAARGVEDTIDKLHQDFGRMLGDAEHWRQFLHKGYQRESRLWEQEGLFGPSIPFSGPLSTIFSMGMRPFLPNDSAMAYLLYSEYSPLHLEHEYGFDASFRDRFEDLLKAQDGKRLERSCEEKQSGSQVDWIGRIVPLLKDGDSGSAASITIGSTPERQQVVQFNEQHQDSAPQADSSERRPNLKDNVYSDLETELAAYEQYFEKAEQAEHLRRLPQPQTASSSPETTPQHTLPGILSTMTTTERHTAPDGSITTKTVLKKRFADGTEESHETLETTPALEVSTNGVTAWARQRIGDEKFHEQVGDVDLQATIAQTPSDLLKSRPRQNEEQIVHQAKTGRGWFWSS